MHTAIILLLAVLLTAWSLATVVVEASASVHRALAERLEAGTTSLGDRKRLARIEQVLAEQGAPSLCARDVVRSLVSIRLAVLDAAYRQDDVRDREAALGSAREALQQGLWCFPRDGNAWLRLAMVEFAQTGPSEGVAAMLRTSLAMTPSEGWIVAPRIAFASRLDASQVNGIEDLLKADIRTFISHASIPAIAALHGSMDAPARARLLAALTGMDQTRRAAIESAVQSRLTQQDDK
jgi:hypothetical protein